MRCRTSVWATVTALALMAGVATAQQQTGSISGRAIDNSGAVLPGVTVTVSGPALIQPRVLTTSDTGSFRAPDLPIGSYQVRFELPGFKTFVTQDIRLTIGFNAEVNATMEVSAVEETVTVTGESPIVDTKATGTRTAFDLETLQSIPSARDPWVMLERAPGISMDRVNVGGTQSGQQSNYVSRGSATGNNKWSIDGVDITDMSATGASPIYYDFDMLQEMQVSTGGVDASQQTGGVGINFVTRSGTDRFRGSGRYYITDDKFQADNITDEVKLQGSGSGAPIQNIKDYGFEVGGPVARGRLWYWGSYGKQDIKAGIVGFYLPTAECQAIKAALAADRLAPISVKDQRACLGTDGTNLNNYNWKITWVPFQNNRFNFQNTWAEKYKNARDASDTRPIETTFIQSAVPKEYGKWGWDVGPSPLWKFGDQHILSDRWLVEFNYSHLGNNFILNFQEPSLNDVQPIFDIPTGVWARSYQRAGPYIRPTTSYDFTTSYFLPGVFGGDHQFRAGFRYRTAKEHSETHWGGNTVARFRGGVAVEADLYRDAVTDYELFTHAFYLQDTFTLNRLTLNLGIRWDRQDNEALPSSVPAHPFIPDWLPALTFDGADSGVVFNDISPRLGMTYDITGDGKTVAKASYSIYYGQLSPGRNQSPLNPVTAASIRFPWNDLNGDRVVQRNELTLNRASVLSFSGNYNPDNPTALTTTGSVDPNIKNDRTLEFIVGIDREVLPGLALGASYIWRKYDQFQWNDTIGLTSADYSPVTYTPPSCPGTTNPRCETITYYVPNFTIPAPYVYTNRPDHYRSFNGFELVASKRYSNRWMGTFSFAYNDAVDKWTSPNAYEDPTCVSTMCPSSQQYAPESGGSGIDNVFNNAKWLVKASGMYTLPLWDINVAGNWNYRQGYPFPQSIQSPSRPNRAGIATVLLDRMGDVRLPNTYIMDLRVDKSFNLGTVRLIPSMDVFNLTNVNTVLARRRIQHATNANNISGIVAPRVVRFGVRMTW
ncbi:MAG: carboxypeptidase regulatory-like domain-containing protein [Acidobacteria bacterium]|nr:carboxypeptidase regulatory-like domain-containing protein [Acidobacteriota bacterium]